MQNRHAVSLRQFSKIFELFGDKQNTDHVPQHQINIAESKIPQSLQLAAPYLHEQSPVDLLLGVGIFYNLLFSGQIPLGTHLPLLQESQLGWAVSGPFMASNKQKPNATFLSKGSGLPS